MKNLGIVSYLNTVPLVSCLDQYQLIPASPSELASLYNQGKLEAAILPIFDVLTKPDTYIVDNISIASQSESASVLFFYRGSIKSLKKVGLDKSSLTSASLLKLLLKRYYQVDCQFESLNPDLLIHNQDYDGYLLIGDTAIRQRESKLKLMDLGQIWNEWTGLPFVFAVWACREKDEQLKLDLIKSKEWGLNHLKELVEKSPFPNHSFLEKYYQFYLHYDLGEKEKQAIKLFQQLLYEENMIPNLLDLDYF